MNCLVDYEYKITCEDVGKTIEVFDKNYVQTVNSNARYMSYY